MELSALVLSHERRGSSPTLGGLNLETESEAMNERTPKAMQQSFVPHAVVNEAIC
jgi:hypothetical protein